MKFTEMRDKLQKLLERRDNYFQLTALEKKTYRQQFEEMQDEIIKLKIFLDIYHDELDVVSIYVDYSCPVDSKEQYAILNKAQEDREIWWLLKKFDYQSKISEYVGLLRKDVSEIKNEWLRDICIMHQVKREGFIQCPWPTKLGGEIIEKKRND